MDEKSAANTSGTTKMEWSTVARRISLAAEVKGQPWGKNNFRWISDGSEPSFTNWGGGEPNNVVPHEMFVRMEKSGYWLDINNSNYWVPSYIICMADTYVGVEE
uniref:C-type lectin domain-containing protein n=1 Tax=Steinernema glaseri TaxID=37863 RepID=A0A1I8AV01_9BILA